MFESINGCRQDRATRYHLHRDRCHPPEHDVVVHKVRYLSSAHFNDRPSGIDDVDLIILHAISLPPGEFEPDFIEALFTGALDVSAHPSFSSLLGLHVSPHFLINRKGVVTQFVPVSKRAWHAGQSTWLGRENCNNYSIGIEIIGDEETPFTRQQYRETARLCRVLISSFPTISRQNIVGHCNVAPGRKWDPGAQWNWDRFYESFVRIRKLNLELR